MTASAGHSALLPVVAAAVPVPGPPTRPGCGGRVPWGRYRRAGLHGEGVGADLVPIGRLATAYGAFAALAAAALVGVLAGWLYDAHLEFRP